MQVIAPRGRLGAGYDHGLEGLSQSDLAGYDRRKPGAVRKIEIAMYARPAHVGVDHHDALAGHGQGHGQIADRRRLALALGAAGDDDRAHFSVDAHEIQIAAQHTEGLGTWAVRLAQRDKTAVAGQLLRDLRQPSKHRQTESFRDLLVGMHTHVQLLGKEHRG